jgi:import inner membrane translocase subunit TIM21
MLRLPTIKPALLLRAVATPRAVLPFATSRVGLTSTALLQSAQFHFSASPSFQISNSFHSSSSSGSSNKNSNKNNNNAPPKISLLKRISLFTSFSFYSVVVLSGVGLLGLVIYYFVSELLLPTSDVQLFNKTFSIIKKDPECQRLIGAKMQAHGETNESGTSNKWARTRPLASKRGLDRYGREHVWLQFHVEGELLEPGTDALVRMEMIRDPHGSNTFEYRYLVLELPNQPRVYLIDNTPHPAVKAKSTGFLGVKWGKKEENNDN